MTPPADIFQGMEKNQCFSKIDLSKGYWQIPVRKEDIPKTMDCHYEFLRMPFGMMNSGATLTRAVKKLLCGMVNVVDYIDDLLIHTETWEAHVKTLSELFKRLQEATFTVRPVKCLLGSRTVDFLGHSLGRGAFGLYDENVEKERAYNSLKVAVTSKPDLQLPDVNKKFVLRTDASDRGLGAALIQENEGTLFPAAYASKKLTDRERKYSVTEREALAIVWGVKEFSLYLYGTVFTLQTDHGALQILKAAKFDSPRIMRWALALQVYSFDVQYIKGSENVGAAYLSRIDRSSNVKDQKRTAMDPFDYVHTLGEIEKISSGTSLVKEFLEKFPMSFIETLCSWIQFGEKRCDMCMLMIYMLKYEQKTYLLWETSDQTVLHLAATFHSCKRLVTTILEIEPVMASAVRYGPHAGLTPLHIIISKGDIETTEACLKLMNPVDRGLTFNSLATGIRFKRTVLMGETALSAAILKFLPEGVASDSSDLLALTSLLVDAGASLDDQNSRGDTAIHTLIRYAHLYPERRNQVLEMLAELQHFMLTPATNDRNTWGRRFARKVWFQQNKEQMTALQLAATLGEHEIVCFIMELQWIYRTLHDYDGIFETNKYDITEIDTLAKIEWCKDQEKNFSQLFLEHEPLCKKIQRLFLCYDSVVARRSTPAILEVICEIDVEAACSIISTPVVRKLISAKWKRYKYWFYLWAFYYISSLFFMSAYASFKFRYVHYLSKTISIDGTNNDSISQNATESRIQPVRFAPSSLDEPTELQIAFINIGCTFALIFSLFSIYLEIVRSFVQRKPWNLLLVHHNGQYRLLLFVNALALGVDSVWFLLSPRTNHKTPMILALLSGWWFSTFFLRPFKKFSFFTVMLIKVLLGDMLRFFTIIIIALASFTMAMHLLFLNSQKLPKEFESLPYACLTMFKLMLGLTELEILEAADPAWLAVTLFVVYVLLTYVLLINSLIAMMSNTCSEIAGQKANQWKIQRLSVILFLENMMLCGLVRTAGTKNYFRKNEDGVEARYVIKDMKVHESDKKVDLGHDIRQKQFFVISKPLREEPSSSLEDLWNISDDSNDSAGKESTGRVSLAESFVMRIDKKFKRASKKVRSYSPVSADEKQDLIEGQSPSTDQVFDLAPENSVKQISEPTTPHSEQSISVHPAEISSLRQTKTHSVSSASSASPPSPSPGTPLPEGYSRLSTPLSDVLPRSSSPPSSPPLSPTSSSPLSPSSIAITQPLVMLQSTYQTTPSFELHQIPKNRTASIEFRKSEISRGLTPECNTPPSEETRLSTVLPGKDESEETEIATVYARQVESEETYFATVHAGKDKTEKTLCSRMDGTEEIQIAIVCRDDRASLESQKLEEEAQILRLSEDEITSCKINDEARMSLQSIKYIDELNDSEKAISPRSTSSDRLISAIENKYVLATDSDKETIEISDDKAPIAEDNEAVFLQRNRNIITNVNDNGDRNIITNIEDRDAEIAGFDAASADADSPGAVSSKTGVGERDKNARGVITHSASLERDPKWLALLESIRNLDKQKRQTSRQKRRPSQSNASSIDVRKRRNAFIKGLGASYDTRDADA
ncbi:transient receptor potential cation channel subfamily v member 1 [Plakobranchus ocellatus]|uniref:Transient receptor potential cation channel subfamily v member 1 n=1 Tax=Plakobranchus ocellatus TaxID=259542 RepID=A0AAV4CWJ2_9GAST|nr:transient receptor potential cation channel subfamily v member 1 [Plakobranchus ocellatus]